MSLPQNIVNAETEIAALLARDESNESDWIEIKLELCRLLAATRKEFKDNKAFGKWFDKHFGASISINDRAAFISMGADLDKAREVFEKTQRKSIQLIYEKEFKDKPKIGHNSKTGGSSRDRSTSRGQGAEFAPGVSPRKPVFTMKEFNQLQKVLHSDRKEAITVKEMDAALALLLAHKDELVGSKEQQKASKAKAKADGAQAQPAAEEHPATA